uniref:Cytochrome c oxidase subunit 3 n=1 Tax=Tjalfiella sp. TaxID=3119615 RepID=A0AAU8JQG5_9METZ
MITHILPSYFPFFISISLSLFFISLVYSLYYKSSLVLLCFFIFFSFSILFFFFFNFEVKDFSYLQYFFNSQYFYFFIFSEFCFFFGVFWAVFWGLYGYDFYNSNLLALNLGVYLIYPYGLPLLNTLLLLTSACYATIFHELYLDYFYDHSLYYCFIFGFIFLLIQYFEFFSSSFTINYSCFGSLFFFSTGFHGFHVFMGLFFILLFIIVFNFLSINTPNYLNVSLLYWHFVDVIWLFLFIFVYTILFTFSIL